MGSQKPSLTSDSGSPATQDQIEDFRNQTGAALEKGNFLQSDLYDIRCSGQYVPRYQRFMQELALESRAPVFDLADVTGLLGQNNVITREQNVNTFKQITPKGMVVVCPSIIDVQACIELNMANACKWVLTYASALSLQDQHCILGTTSKPKYMPGNDWFLDPREKMLAEERPEPGYYLLNMQPLWNETSWQQQENNIAGVGVSFERAHECVFSQALLAYQQAHWERRFFKDVCHWGRLLDSKGNRVRVRLSLDGLLVERLNPVDRSQKDVFVCMGLKSQHRVLVG